MKQVKDIKTLYDVLTAAQAILNDFDQYGEVLQTDYNGLYGDTSPIEVLRRTIDSVEVTQY